MDRIVVTSSAGAAREERRLECKAGAAHLLMSCQQVKQTSYLCTGMSCRGLGAPRISSWRRGHGGSMVAVCKFDPGCIFEKESGRQGTVIVFFDQVKGPPLVLSRCRGNDGQAFTQPGNDCQDTTKLTLPHHQRELPLSHSRNRNLVACDPRINTKMKPWSISETGRLLASTAYCIEKGYDLKETLPVLMAAKNYHREWPSMRGKLGSPNKAFKANNKTATIDHIRQHRLHCLHLPRDIAEAIETSRDASFNMSSIGRATRKSVPALLTT